MDIKKLTIGEAETKLEEYKELAKALNRSAELDNNTSDHWELNKNYFIRTVTHHYTGKLTRVTDKELVLESACWIADDGRFKDAIESCEFDEVEPYPDRPVIIGRGAILDAVQIKTLPEEQK